MNTVEKPMLFSGPEIPRLLDGSKTMTRRIQPLTAKTVLDAEHRRIGFEFCAEQAHYDYPVANMPRLHIPIRHPDDKRMAFADCGCATLHPPHPVGSRIWVKEAFGVHRTWADKKLKDIDQKLIGYRAGGGVPGRLIDKWKSPLLMPKQFARIWLEVTAVKVEKLGSISEEDAKAEGISIGPVELWKGATSSHKGRQTARRKFEELWNSIHGPGSWDRDKEKWCWCYTLKRKKP